MTPTDAGRAPTTDDPDAVLEVFLRHPEVHPYGIADVAQLWERSRWWQDGPAVAGIIDLPGSPVPVVYAVSAGAEQATLRLLDAIAPTLPDHVVATGPRGMAAGLAACYRPVWGRDCVKMHLADPRRLPPADPGVVTLGPGDLGDLRRLFSADPSTGEFFVSSLLDTGLYVGWREDGALLATAGTHVLDPTHGVAAIGNVATHPAHRRRGLGRKVTAALCRRLLDDVTVVGLNVAVANASARALYAALGFVTVLPYEEAEFVRQGVRSPS